MKKVILKSFGTGQITLPKMWRDKFKTNYFVASIDKEKITIKPFKEEEEEVFFDAAEFNKGKGVDIQDFYKALKKSLKNG